MSSGAKLREVVTCARKLFNTASDVSFDSWTDAITFGKSQDFSHFLAVGGGSSMDTAKVANLYSCYPDADILDFVNAPVGKGLPIAKRLKPLIAVPTTVRSASPAFDARSKLSIDTVGRD